MRLRNSADNYGLIAKCLHWLTALLFFGAYFSVYYRHWFTDDKTPENWTALQLHLSIGLTIGVVVALRILWRLTNRVPNLEAGTKLEHWAAHAGHYALYAIMIVLPVTGFLGTKVDTEYFFLFDIPMFESTSMFGSMIREGMGITYEQFEAPLDFVHKELLGKWLAWMLILGHVLAALYHHFVKHDRTLQKMTVDSK